MSLRVAVIGAGHIGSHHLAAYHSHPEAEIVAVCDLVKERAIAATQQYGGTPYSNLAAMLAKEQIDSVSVVTAGAQNGSHHYGPAMQCFAAGKHVLCEKPLSNQLSEARSMVARANQSDVRFGCDLNHRFTPQAETAKRWINDG